MVWGAMSKTRTYPLVRVDTTLTGEGYAALLDQFFKDHGRGGGLRASSQPTRPKLPWVFQHDNALVHRSNAAEAV